MSVSPKDDAQDCVRIDQHLVGIAQHMVVPLACQILDFKSAPRERRDCQRCRRAWLMPRRTIAETLQERTSPIVALRNSPIYFLFEGGRRRETAHEDFSFPFLKEQIRRHYR
jgi:hypothetical protein